MKYLIYLVYDGGDAGTISLSVLDKDVKLAKKIFNDADDFLVVADKPAENSDIVDFYEWVDEKRERTIREMKSMEEELVGVSREALDRKYQTSLMSYNSFRESVDSMIERMINKSSASGWYPPPICLPVNDVKDKLKSRVGLLKEELELLSKVK